MSRLIFIIFINLTITFAQNINWNDTIVIYTNTKTDPFIRPITTDVLINERGIKNDDFSQVENLLYSIEIEIFEPKIECKNRNVLSLIHRDSKTDEILSPISVYSDEHPFWRYKYYDFKNGIAEVKDIDFNYFTIWVVVDDEAKVISNQRGPWLFKKVELKKGGYYCPERRDRGKIPPPIPRSR